MAAGALGGSVPEASIRALRTSCARCEAARWGVFLPQYGKGPDGLRTMVWVETARAYAARVAVPLVDAADGAVVGLDRSARSRTAGPL